MDAYFSMKMYTVDGYFSSDSNGGNGAYTVIILIKLCKCKY